MWVTMEQAAEIYARFCQARYGGDAFAIARQRAFELRKAGDAEGEPIWNKVAEEIDPVAARPKICSAA